MSILCSCNQSSDLDMNFANPEERFIYSYRNYGTLIRYDIIDKKATIACPDPLCEHGKDCPVTNIFTAYVSKDYIMYGKLENGLLGGYTIYCYDLINGIVSKILECQSMIGSPELVVMDEPTAGLDPMQRIAFKNFLSKQKEKMTILISTHIVSDVEEIADEVIFLKKGRIVKSGSLKQVTEELNGKCWRVSHESEVDGSHLYRVIGDEVRVISDVKPSPDAVPIEATLEECYLDIFGVE